MAKIKHFDGWNRREDLPRLLLARDLRACGAEVGAGAGIYSAQIADRWPGNLILVDLWARTDYYQAWPESRHEKHLAMCRQLQSRFPDRIHLLRQESTAAASAVRARWGASLDFVYIDAEHSYEGCMRDIETWSPLVRSGGILAGHDFCDGLHPKTGIRDMVFGVRTAVNEYADRRGLEIFVTREDDPVEAWPSWFMVMP